MQSYCTLYAPLTLKSLELASTMKHMGLVLPPGWTYKAHRLNTYEHLIANGGATVRGGWG